MRWRWLLGIAIVIAVGLLGWPEPSKPACAGCRKQCTAGEERDPRGCCRAGKAKATKKVKKAKKKKAKKKKKSATVKAATSGGSTEPLGIEVPPPEVKKSKRKQRSVADLSEGCRDGSDDDCAEFAAAYDGYTPELDESTLATMYVRGCDADGARACLQAGLLYESGKGIDQDFNKALKAYQKSCDRDDSFGCHALGRIYYLALGVVKDVDRAMKLFRRACDDGIAASCSDLGYAYENAKYDYVSAAEWYLTACDRDNATGCGNAAALFSQAGDEDRASQLRVRACTLDSTRC